MSEVLPGSPCLPAGIVRPATLSGVLVLEQVLQVARRLAHPSDLNELLEEVVASGRDALQTDRASVLLLDRDANEFYSRATSDGDTLRFPADKGIAGETLRTRILRIDDCYADPRFNREVDKQTGYRTNNMISVALVGSDDQAVGVMQLLNAEKGHFDDQDEALAETFAAFAAVAIQRAQAEEVRLAKAQLERDLDVARELQMALLPKKTPELPGYEIATFFQPADQTGGDMFDLFPIPGTEDTESPGLTILLADATGHGIGAAVSVTQVRSMLRTADQLGADLEALCRHLNNQLADDLPSGKFVTAFFGRLRSTEHELHYRSMGQAPLLHYIAAESRKVWLNASSVPMGLLPDPPLPRPEPIHMAPGDTFVLLSDGFYEQSNMDGEEMGKERVGAIVEAQLEHGAEAIVENLCSELDRFSGSKGQEDDLTAVVLRRLPD